MSRVGLRTSVLTVASLLLTTIPARVGAQDVGSGRTDPRPPPQGARDDATPRPGPPTPIEQEQAEKLVREIYAVDYRQTGSASKSALARKLLAKAQEETSDSTTRFVLLREARDVAVASGDVSTAFAAIDQLERSFRIDSLDMRRQALSAPPSSKLTLIQKESLADAWIALLDQAVREDEYRTAMSACADADAAAKNLKDGAIAKRIKNKIVTVEAITSAFEALSPHLEKLLDDPESPAANLAVGKFYCFVKKSLEAGLPHLARSPPSPLQAAATLDLAVQAEERRTSSPRSPTYTAGLVGDAWFDRAASETGERRKLLRQRAVTWYRKASSSLTGLAKTRVDKRLSELAEIAEVTLEPVRISELASFCYSKRSRGWTELPLDEFTLSRRGSTLAVRNNSEIQTFAYLVRKPAVTGDYVAEIAVKGAIGVGLVSQRASSYVYQVEAPLNKSSSHLVRIERKSGKLTFTVNRRIITPTSSRYIDLSRGVYIYVRIGRRKTAYISRFDVFAPQAAESRNSRSRNSRSRDRSRTDRGQSGTGPR